MENLNQQKHEEALKQKELDSSQLLEYIKYNELEKNSKLESELTCILLNNEMNLNELAKQSVTRCLQLAKGYTEYKVNEIAEHSGFNKTRIKALIQYLIEMNKIELISLDHTTFIKCA